ncbi:Hpt domain-containing protein [uncultured Eudoraea sp.]|uniref:Hpt domain-containing protein n=1 Tax=uncultured Eudoraea sp. TaxID=1035614 RepID=UPI00260374C5|nr:Hpt domain-containing protein [uncultured Eudoraea sp.]
MKEIPNLNYINRLSKGNKVFAKNLVDIIKKELPREVETYQLHLNEGDFDKTAEDVHKINHKIKILGLENGCRMAEEYRIGLLKKSIKLKQDFESILTSMLIFIEKVYV